MVVNVDGKPVTLDDSYADLGVEAIRDALSVDIPDIENATITIQKGDSAPAIVTSRTATVVRQATPKG